jgi:hypothetical protein
MVSLLLSDAQLLRRWDANSYKEQASEALITFLSGPSPLGPKGSDLEPESELSLEQPRKRRKVTCGNAAKKTVPSSVWDEHLTLARVDICLV